MDRAPQVPDATPRPTGWPLRVPRATGFLLGAGLGGASWLGNLSRTNLGLVSAFPDVLTIAAVPLALYFLVRARLKATPMDDRRRLRRFGWAVVNTAAVVFAVFLASVQGFWFNQLDTGLIGPLIFDALVVTVGVGYLSVEIWIRLLQGVHR